MRRFAEGHTVGRAIGKFLTRQDSAYVREFVMAARQREVREAEAATEEGVTILEAVASRHRDEGHKQTGV